MFIIEKQSIINIRSDTNLQNAKNVRKFKFRGHGLRITLKPKFLQLYFKSPILNKGQAYWHQSGTNPNFITATEKFLSFNPIAHCPT